MFKLGGERTGSFWTNKQKTIPPPVSLYAMLLRNVQLFYYLKSMKHTTKKYSFVHSIYEVLKHKMILTDFLIFRNGARIKWGNKLQDLRVAPLKFS